MSQTLNPIQQLGRLGQSVWYDNMYRALIETGELQRLIDSGITGLTSNPTIFEKAISSSDDYDESLVTHARRSSDPQDLFEGLAIEDIRAAADLLLPIYEGTGGADGFASLEVNPHLAHDTGGTIKAARRLFLALDRPNVMIKVPATPEGIPAIRDLIGRGINVNVTLIFSLAMYTRVREAYMAGLKDLIASGGDPSRVSSVASFFVSRVDTSVDSLIADSDGALDDLQGKAAVANAKIAYQDFRATFGTDRFGSMAERGARVQRPLWASTSTKNPDYSDVLYVETLIGPDTVNTMPDATLAAFMEHGTARTSIEDDVDQARDAISALESGGIRMEAVTTQLMHDGVKAFADSFDELLENIVAKRDKLLSALAAPAEASLGKARATADEAVASLQETDAVARIWSGDHTIWSSDPTEITDRLGWLDTPSSMLDCVDDLSRFARDVRDEGTEHVVLLGMGGSSLGAEVLRQALGHREGLARADRARLHDSRTHRERGKIYRRGSDTVPGLVQVRYHGRAEHAVQVLQKRRGAHCWRRERGRQVRSHYRRWHGAGRTCLSVRIQARIPEQARHRRPVLGAELLRPGSLGFDWLRHPRPPQQRGSDGDRLRTASSSVHQRWSVVRRGARVAGPGRK